MFSIINLESWLAEEAAIVQKSTGDREIFLHEWLQKLDEYLISAQVTRVWFFDLCSRCCVLNLFG